MMPTSTCNTCKYLHRSSNAAGQCRRHTPSRDEVNAAVFPWVNTLVDWCGEYVGNTEPLTKAEIKAFIDPNLMPTIQSIKPTPYRKNPSP